MELICPRCSFHLQPIDDAPPPFCAQCGLPQLRVSPDAQTYLPAAEPIPGQPEAAGADPGMDWPKALGYVALAALLGVLPPAALPGALSSGAIGGPTLLLTPVLTLVLVSLYHNGRPRRVINAAIGARIGDALGRLFGKDKKPAKAD